MRPLLIGGLLLFAGHASAGVLFTSYVGNDAGGSTTTSDYEGIQFTATGSGSLFQVLVSPFAFGATNPVTWPLTLYTDSAGEPGTALETWDISVTGSGVVPIIVTSVVQPMITAGDVYWLVVQNTTPGSITAMGWENYSGDLGGFWIGDFNTLNSMIQVFPTEGLAGAELTTTPEPGSSILLVAGGLILLGIARMRKALVQ